MPSDEVKVLADQLIVSNDEEAELAKEFVCKICLSHVVGYEPKLATCSHIFCGDCVAAWFATCPSNQTWAQRAKSGGSIPCPVCKQPLRKEDLHAVCADGNHESVLLHQLLSSMSIVCGNSSKCNSQGRCNWTGTYGEYQSHIQACTNETLECYEKQEVEAELRLPTDSWADADEHIETAADKAVVVEAASDEEGSRSTRFSSGNDETELLSDCDGTPAVEKPVADDQLACSGDVPAEAAVLPAVSPTQMSLNDLIGALVQLKAKDYEAAEQPGPSSHGRGDTDGAVAGPEVNEPEGCKAELESKTEKPKAAAKATSKKAAKSGGNKAKLPAAPANAMKAPHAKQLAHAQAIQRMQLQLQWQAAQALQWQTAAQYAQMRQVAQWQAAAQWQAQAEMFQAAKGGYASKP
eukprot:TRINITY_DN124702_c0_g1_i1.p1 TRINITY_DN124702_c0_g1~~TRINITY_DN124702_c0_g1_i1.p1  ORF type:complete len:441 (-),score=121.81 TRINITY_DN124702_c0_g1_i1:398-1621(-)